MNILISGASIAGPVLAFWLTRCGFRVTVVERAPALRAGGFAVDFRGPVHLMVLDRMGVLEEVRRQQTHMGEQVVVDEDGRRLVSLPSAFMSGDVEIERGDLSRILYDRTKDTAEYVFGDSITSLTETADGVRVEFSRAKPRTFDVVVGADGLHSGVRALAFGDESQFMRFLGYYVAGGITIPNDFGLDHSGLLFNVPGRLADISSARNPAIANAVFVFASEPLDYDRRAVDRQKQIVAERFAGVGWKVPRLIEAMWETPDMYFDSISQVRMDRYSSGRVVLLGDAAYGATFGGLGTGLAMVGAYVLAGELAAADGDHRIAFGRYEERMRSYAEGCQKLATNAGPFLAPPTTAKLRSRNRAYRVLSWRPLTGVFNRMTTKAASAIALPDYPQLRAAVNSLNN